MATATPTLDDLLAATERAWIDRHDAGVVDRLAAEHPEHAEELYTFFSGLVFGDDESSVPHEVARQAAERTRAWLDDEGFERAREAAHRSPRTFALFLQRRTRQDPETIARRIGDVSWELLAQVSRYPALVPRPVREELASRIERHWPIPAAESLRAIETSAPMPRAASRRHPYPPPPSTFEELLGRSSLTARQRSLWAEVAGA